MIDLHATLQQLGINKFDTLMVHGNAGVAAQLISIDSNERLEYLFNQLVEYVKDEGTIVIPTFSYSFTKGENFNVDDTESSVGQFSEIFRKKFSTSRSHHPIFSMCSIGKFSNEFKQTSNQDCFGENTAFDLLYKKNAKIICLGCDINRITFTHYVEQAAKVPYRYFKFFSGLVISKNSSYKQETSYFVRDIDKNSISNLDKLKEELIKRGAYKEALFGRYLVSSISAMDFFNVASELISKDPNSLIKQESK
jgi:aminoglycoside 3-N-acetyltransferase